MGIVECIKIFKQRFFDKRILKRDIDVYFNQYSTSINSIKNGNQFARNIMVFCHVIEKGLSHKKLKPLFGYERAILISENLNNYINSGGADKFIISMAMNTLNHYNSVNKSLGVSSDKLIQITQNIEYEELDVGARELTKEQFFFNNSNFKSICMNRHSLRLYDCHSAPIDNEDIVESIKEAQSAPSACNRQSIRVKILKNKDLMKKVFDIQGGANGFGHNAGALLIVTADISLYEPSERRLPTLDAGLFIMNLVYALYDKKIGTCILNGSFTEEREYRIKKIVPIPENEMYCAVIALSKIPELETVMVAKSCKRNVNDIVTYL